MKMESLKLKKEQRIKKKMSKMSALLAVAALNEKDRKTKQEKDALEKDAPTNKKMKIKDELNITSDEEEQKNYLVSPECTNYDELKTEVQQLKSRRVHPQFNLKVAGEQASLITNIEDRIPILFTDLQHLLLSILLGDDSPYRPSRWCNMKKISRISNITVLIVEDASLYHYVSNESIFNNFNKIFSNKLEIVTPSLYGGSVVEELAVVPLSEAEKQCLIKEYGSLDVAIETRKDLMTMMKAVFPITNGIRPTSTTDDLSGDKFSRAQLVLSAWQLVEENYPLPLKGKLLNTYSDYVMTKDTYNAVTSKSPMFGLDCEMCQTTAGSELTRVSLVNEKHEIVYEKFVLPHNKIINYLTQYSGIKESDLRDVTTRVQDVQKDLKEFLPSDAILVGQSLNFDLHALKMMHPYVIDTSIIFNLTGQRSRKSKLRDLAKQFLKENIQKGNQGHCSVEDSLSALKLVQLKLSQDISFGDAVLQGKKTQFENLDHLKTTKKEYATSIFNEVTKKQKSIAILGDDNTIERYNNYVKNIIADEERKTMINTHSLKGNADLIEKTNELCQERDLIISHIKLDSDKTCELTALKQIDKSIKKIWKSLKIDSFMIVLFAGDEQCNGVTFIDIKNTHSKL